MPLQAKHIVEEINGTRCTIVEKGISKERSAFLKSLLEFNKFEVIIVEDKKEVEDAPTLYTLGVTDLVFNPVIAVYEFALKNPEGNYVSPDYWDQKRKDSIDQYWLTKEETLPGKSAWFYKIEEK
ncbi:MAG: hypothetical protein HXX13_02005 [Bacteroidetes bacterium]|nr:hypothetical protein [Bacteroidota bacterium]